MKLWHPVVMGAAFVCALVSGRSAIAQDELEDYGEITVTSPRVETPITKVPYAVDLVTKDDIQLGTQQLGLDESLTKIPGVFMLNRYNFAQDLRIAIRGFGARADFGIRGIRLFADDIPLTLPDGQGGIDSIDLASAERIEVIRGPSSSLYGAASGGVINIITEEGPEIPFVEGRYTGGSYGFHKYNLKTGGQRGDLNYLFNIGRYELDGYRDNSQTESVIGNGKFIYDIDETSDFTTVINFVDSPIAQDAGGLTLEDARADRKQASANNLRFDAGEAIDQQQVGFVYRKEFREKHELRLRNYYVWRDFQQKLPIGPTLPFIDAGGVVGFERFYVGGGAQYTYKGNSNRLTLGFDVDEQDDDRVNYDNLDGVVGPLTLQQNETVSSLGFYAQNEQYLTDQWTLTTGIRYDRVEFDVTDRFLADGDDSGVIEFDEVSPLIGLLWSPLQELNVYANVSTAFETPSTTEFGNPMGGGGFNQGLQPQTATNYEIGIKGVVPRWYGLTYSAAAFYIEGDDELVPVNIDENVFTNAGETRRRGLELSLSANPIDYLTVSFAYTYSDFEYRRFSNEAGTSFAGNNIPGVPEHFGFFELAYNHPSGYYAIWDTLLVSDFFADDANVFGAHGYGVSNLRAGYIKTVGDTEVSPFIGINNIFDKEYFSNVRVNAPGNRFFEPAPEINFYAGISVRHNFL